MIRVLITGASGQLGQEIVKTALPTWEMISLSRQELDICLYEKAKKTISAINPQVIINAAAYTAVDKAEEEDEKAYAVNEMGVENLSKISKKVKARFIHISTDFVFDGSQSRPYTPEDQPNPLGIYGKSKLEGEKRALQITQGRALIIRTSWLYTSTGNNFVLTILRLLEQKDALNVVDDQIGTPTWARGLAKVTWKFAKRPQLTGIYQWSDAGVASWYDFAVAIQEEAYHLGLLSRIISIYPIHSDKYPLKAPRPYYSVLDKERTYKDLKVIPTHWRINLRECLKEIKDKKQSGRI